MNSHLSIIQAVAHSTAPLPLLCHISDRRNYFGAQFYCIVAGATCYKSTWGPAISASQDRKALWSITRLPDELPKFLQSASMLSFQSNSYMIFLLRFVLSRLFLAAAKWNENHSASRQTGPPSTGDHLHQRV